MKHRLAPIVSYAMDERPDDPDLASAIEAVTHTNSRVMCISIVKWLKLDDEPKRCKPLSLFEGAEWQRLLPQFVMSVPALNDLFEIGPKYLDFRPTVSILERKTVRQFVRDHYRPTCFR